MAYASTTEQVERFRELAAPKREPNGRAQREPQPVREEAILATSTRQPHRRHLPKTWKDDSGREHPLEVTDPRAGFALGRLFIARQINENQLHAGNKAADRINAYIRIRTPAGLGYGALDLNRSGGGGGEGADMPDATIARIREDMAEITHALKDTSSPADCLEVLVLTCAMDEDVRRHDVLGYLREGLNVLHRAWEKRR